MGLDIEIGERTRRFGAPRGPDRLPTNNRGFTLIELMIVVSIIGILAAIAVPNYQWGIIKTKESVLREDLYNFRSTIDQFYADQGKYPDSLQELVGKGYLHGIPKDPFTKTDDWITEPPPAGTAPAPSGSSPSSVFDTSTIKPGQVLNVDQGNVYDVHSNSPLIGTDGKAYKDY